MTFRNFEEIDAWQTARKIVAAIYRISKGRSFGRDFALRDQIRRAAVSIMANIAEGFSRRSGKEFVQFLFAAKASAAEVQSHLYVALDQAYLNAGEFKDLYTQTEISAKQVSGLISYLLGHKKARAESPQG